MATAMCALQLLSSGDFVQHILFVDEVTAALYQLEQLADVGVPLGENLLRTIIQ